MAFQTINLRNILALSHYILSPYLLQFFLLQKNKKSSEENGIKYKWINLIPINWPPKIFDWFSGRGGGTGHLSEKVGTAV